MDRSVLQLDQSNGLAESGARITGRMVRCDLYRFLFHREYGGIG